MVLRRWKQAWWLALALALVSHLGAAQTEAELAGTWRGTIGTVEPLEIAVRLERVEAAWSGTIAIPADAEVELPLEEVAVDEDEVRFAVAGLRAAATFEGTLVDGRIEGTFRRNGEELPFRLQRHEEPAPDEPAPVEPAPDEPSPDEQAPGEAYQDPRGRFSVPIPAGWTLMEREDHVVLSDPDDAIRIALAVVDEDDLEAAIEEAWSRAEPRFDQPVAERIEPSPDPGVDEMLVIRYESEPGLVWQAIARLHEGTAHVVVIAAELEVAQQRDAQIDVILSGYRIVDIVDP